MAAAKKQMNAEEKIAVLKKAYDTYKTEMESLLSKLETISRQDSKKK